MRCHGFTQAKPESKDLAPARCSFPFPASIYLPRAFEILRRFPLLRMTTRFRPPKPPLRKGRCHPACYSPPDDGGVAAPLPHSLCRGLIVFSVIASQCVHWRGNPSPDTAFPFAASKTPRGRVPSGWDAVNFTHSSLSAPSGYGSRISMRKRC